MSPPVVVLGGASAIVLAAPHAGRRDATRRPWGSAPLKMNDLHTGSLTRELATRLDASAILNEQCDRNDVDLNRVSAAHERAPAFLEALASALEAAIGRHGRAVLLTIHGWNVVQPAVDLGFGARPAADPFRIGPRAAASDGFVATRGRLLMGALHARGIAATPGLRYPARAPENLVQLFTPRYVADPRPLVRRLAALADRTDAVQLELGLPLRIPGPWRDMFLAACAHALTEPAPEAGEAPWMATTSAAPAVGLEFVGTGVSGLAARDGGGGRLLLFPDDGGLVTFTAERVGAHPASGLAGLAMEADEVGLEVRYDGPMLRFPDTTPFVDLEQGLAAALVVDAHVRLRLTTAHVDDAGCPCPFGRLRGRAVIGAAVLAIDGHGVRARRTVPGGRRARVALCGSERAILVDGGEGGFVCHRNRHVALARARVTLAATRLAVHGETADGESVSIDGGLVHRLPVVRGGTSPGRLLFAACRTAEGLSGWAELPGH